MERYRIARAGKEIGEYDIDMIRDYLVKGNLVPTDHAWKQGMGGWQTLAELGIATAAKAPPPPLSAAQPEGDDTTATTKPSSPYRYDPKVAPNDPRGNAFVTLLAWFFLPVGIYIFASSNYPKKTKRFLGFWYAGMLAFMIFASATYKHVPSAEPPHQVFVNAKQFVLRALKAPSTAQFPGIVGDNAVRAHDYFTDGTIYVEGVTSWVDAQNSFGAMIRSEWKVWYMRDGSEISSQLKPVWIRVGDSDALGNSKELGRLRELAKKPGGLRKEFDES